MDLHHPAFLFIPTCPESCQSQPPLPVPTWPCLPFSESGQSVYKRKTQKTNRYSNEMVFLSPIEEMQGWGSELVWWLPPHHEDPRAFVVDPHRFPRSNHRWIWRRELVPSWTQREMGRNSGKPERDPSWLSERQVPCGPHVLPLLSHGPELGPCSCQGCWEAWSWF